MARKYEVHIDGMPLRIVGTPDAPDSSEQLLIQHVTSRSDVAQAVERWSHSAERMPLVLHGRDVEEVWDWFRAPFVFVQAAGGCVADERHRLLMIHRLGMWDLPKGKVDDGETVEAGALREVREECGLITLELQDHLCATWHTYTRKRRQHLKRTDWYLMRGSAQEPLTAQAEEDITEARWFSQAEVRDIRSATYPSLHRVLDAWEQALR